MLVEQEYEGLYRYCLYHLRIREDAEDVVQETFLRYLQHPEYHKPGHEREYLYTIARNLCIDAKRRIQPAALSEVQELSDPSDLAEQTELRLALEALTHEEREIALLRFVSGEGISVIAKIYGVSRFVMSRRIRQIQKKLKEMLGREGKV